MILIVILAHRISPITDPDVVLDRYIQLARRRPDSKTIYFEWFWFDCWSQGMFFHAFCHLTHRDHVHCMSVSDLILLSGISRIASTRLTSTPAIISTTASLPITSSVSSSS